MTFDFCINTPDSGEHVEAITLQSGSYVLSIGTEDAGSLYRRADQEDWFPLRLQKLLSLQKGISITEYLHTGFETNLPQLQPGERIYLHYLAAFAERKASIDYPGEESCATWSAVNWSKSSLLNRLG